MATTALQHCLHRGGGTDLGRSRASSNRSSVPERAAHYQIGADPLGSGARWRVLHVTRSRRPSRTGYAGRGPLPNCRSSLAAGCRRGTCPGRSTGPEAGSGVSGAPRPLPARPLSPRDWYQRITCAPELGDSLIPVGGAGGCRGPSLRRARGTPPAPRHTSPGPGRRRAHAHCASRAWARRSRPSWRPSAPRSSGRQCSRKPGRCG